MQECQQLLTKGFMMQGLTEGRIVHFVLPDGQHRAALVSRVWNDDGVVNLHVFVDQANDRQIKADNGILLQTSVTFSEEPQPGTWHWIERA